MSRKTILLPALFVIIASLSAQTTAARIPFLRSLGSGGATAYSALGTGLAVKMHAQATHAKLAALGIPSNQANADAFATILSESRDSGSLPLVSAAIAAKVKSGTASMPELLFFLKAADYVPVDSTMDVKAAIARAAVAAELESAAARFLVSLLNDNYGVQFNYAFKKLDAYGIKTVAQFKERWADVQRYLQDETDARAWVQKLVVANEFDFALKLLDHAQKMRIVDEPWARKTRPPIEAARLRSSIEAATAIKFAAFKPPVVKPEIMGGFVHVPAGLFYMGSPKSEAERGGDESPLHEVQVSDFWMAQHEVTQAEWTAVMGSNPSNFKSTQLPVEQVTWYDVLVYANKRSIMEGRKPCYSLAGKTDPSAWGSVSAAWNGIKCDFTANGYRLPSEAEWEYACRAGTTTATAFGKSLSSKQANFDGTFPYNGAAKGLSVGKTRAVGSYAPNAWGLFDMHGNVHEWCWDWYGNYGAADSKNPSGASSGENRVFRGGGWRLDGSELRSAYRDSGKPGFSSRYLGFRVVRR